jgi:site-specific DNA-methyltransferase (adenine-specific)
MSKIELLQGDCLQEMPKLADKSIDLILCDPPYGITACAFDTVIPLEPMWKQLKRVIKPNGAIVMTASQPFTSALVMSNLKMFKYCWVWDKVTARGHLVAKKRPMAQHEDIVVFYRKAPTYNPQMVKREKPIRGTEGRRTDIMGGVSNSYTKVYTHAYPKTIQTFSMDKRNGHPTQKPVALMEYLIKTYTNEGETVLDFTMGSGTTGVACKNLNRNFIGIEFDQLDQVREIFHAS